MDIESQIVTVDKFTVAINLVQETRCGLRQRIDEQKARWAPTHEATRFDQAPPLPPPPPHTPYVPVPILTFEDLPARLDRLE